MNRAANGSERQGACAIRAANGSERQGAQTATIAGMAEPLAFLLTWTCYGQWLHGDPRGSIDRRHRTPGDETLAPDPARTRAAALRMRGPRVELDARAQEVVRAAVCEHAQVGGWKIHALNVRHTHVHVVVANAAIPPERMMTSFKAWATRRLRDSGLVAPGAAMWTRHGSTRYLWDEQSVARAVDYVVEGQDGPR
jgi:REP element-mobilizing transposase RayT